MANNTQATPPRTWTVTEWADLDPDLGHDLVNGRLVRQPPVAIWHDILLNRLVAIIGSYLRQNGLGELTGQKSRMRISEVKGREPDLFFIPRDQYNRVGLNLFEGVPPMVLEVISPTSEIVDRQEKYAEYAQLGIPEYWIVDFPNRCLEVHRLADRSDGGRSYALAETHRHDAIFRPTLFPGLDVSLAEIWPTEFENLSQN